MNWCRQFCGTFRDEHADHTDDDDENLISDNSRFANMVAKTGQERTGWSFFRRKKKVNAHDSKDGGKSMNARTVWSRYCTYVTLPIKSKGGQESLQKVIILAAKKASMKQAMLNGISDAGQVHTIDLDDCNLTEVPPNLNNIETLVVLQLINNKIRKVQKEVGLNKRLEKLHLGWNQISLLDPELFADESFHVLEVINLRHNKLEVLPTSFGLTAAKPSKIRHVDLSENKIKVLPDSFSSLGSSLQFLDLSHNKLVRLPRTFNFPKLSKLFLSFNEIVELPEVLGDCVKLEKLRMTNNNIRKLPDSMLKLKDTLQEIEVEGNPLITPSITAFQMGGVKQAFKLLEEHVREANEAINKALPSPEQLALDNGDAGLKAQDSLLQLGGSSGDDLGVKHLPSHIQDYYFSHCKGKGGESELEQIREIRNAESTLLIIKRNVYFQQQRALAMSCGKENVPKTMKQFLEPDYNINKWHGDARVTDLDLYFNLLVYTTKPLYSSCYVLFDRFELEDKGYLNKEEWNEFLLFSPILLEDPKVNEGMWQLMAWRHGDRITLNDFIAAWHIHDVEEQDPWIARMAGVLRLDYYNMDIAELQNRLRAKDAEDATPVLNFDQEDPDSDDEVEEEESEIKIEREEGERWVIPKANEKAKQGQKTDSGSAQTKDASKDDGRKIASTEEKEQESMADRRKDHQNEDEGSDASVNSAELSEDEDSDEQSDFDVDIRMRGVGINGLGSTGRLVVDSQEALDKLMLVSPKDFFPEDLQPLAEGKASQKSKKGKNRKKPTRVAQNTRFKTDIFPVQQEIRRVYRNLPHDDFVKLISFLLRGMQMMKHSKSKTHNSFWHADDPTFKFTMGATCSNMYTRRLLKIMGFAILDQLYWVWPSIHMKEVLVDSKKKIPIWGVEEIPESCLGMEAGRLDDMILLLTNCQRSLHKLGKEKFNGSFR